MVDLHVHSTASDGTVSPAGLVRMAKSLGLSALGIADHDTAGGIPEAWEEGQRLGVSIVCGIELSVDYNAASGNHILGYFSRENIENIVPYLSWIRRKREERNHTLVERLNRSGYPISYKEFLEKAGEGTPGRPHLAALLVEKGHAADSDRAFSQILTRPEIHIQREKTSPESAIRAIREGGGIPVLAHPIYLEREGFLNDALEEFVSYGLLGLEAYHSDQSFGDVRRYIRLARQHRLLVTGGSDFHGEHKPEIQMGVPRIPDGRWSMLKKHILLASQSHPPSVPERN